MTTRVPPSLIQHTAPVFRAVANNVNIATGLSLPTAFTSYGTPNFDTASAFNVSNGQFQPTVAGYYQVNVAVSYGAAGVTATVVAAVIMRNGSNFSATSQGSNGQFPVVQNSDVVYLNGTTDYIQAGTYHNASGTANTVNATFSAALVRRV